MSALTDQIERLEGIEQRARELMAVESQAWTDLADVLDYILNEGG